jgi:hypothetical protein
MRKELTASFRIPEETTSEGAPAAACRAKTTDWSRAICSGSSTSFWVAFASLLIDRHKATVNAPMTIAAAA